ncbi:MULTISPECIES: cache domain-containing sensor histidine kinase [Paenibacillus]|uniref:HAMP domain-containing protein n=1 Tax=Paenibacillus albilobatus TaxID=2716884 RepID=A0A919XNC7_9BACL|nr:MULTISPECIES: sensor histidine kinase [Paenibacillus]GIO34583.1 hypothetical protein J2TS6_57240 [Paenibacillus albilobatus]
MFKLNYYRRIQLSFLLFIIVPIITVSVISFVLIKETMVEKLQLTNENFLNVMVDEIGKTIDDATFASHFIVNDTSFKKYLKNFADTDRLRSYDDYTNFTEIKGVFSLITSKPLNNNTRMYLVNRKRFIIPSSEDDTTGVNDRLDELYAKINFKQPETLQWLGMDRGDPGKDGTYYIARVIFDSREKQYLSVLIIGINQAYFEKLLKPVGFGKVALLDAKGNLIAGSAELSAPDPSVPASSLRTEVTLDKTNWTLVYEANKEAFTGKISRTFYAGIGGVILFFIIFSISSMYIAKRLHRPIQKLQRVVRQFGMGNLDVRLEVKGRNDIAELSQTLNTMLDQLQRLVHDIEREQEQKRVMELEALFMQIRPHFLINTLNSIKCSLILQKDRLHSGIIDSLMSLLRAYMKFNEPTSLRDECELMRHYIDIMKIRNDIPVRLEVELDPEIASWTMPKLMLQPLIENAIVHGLVDHPDAQITIRATKSRGFITIEIEDNGDGIEEKRRLMLNERLQSCDSGPDDPYDRVGLINVAQRLRLSFGSEATIALMPNAERGITAVLHIPDHEIRSLLPGRDAS